ncbi:MAG: LIM domain-containing protein [Ktedonobacteraceae bacterium]
MSTQPICKGCGQLINERYVLALSALWHPEHFLRSGCNRPMNSAAFYEHQGRSYHQQFYLKQIASRCAYCGKPLVSKYVKDSWGTKFCAEHTSEYPGCQFCGQLVPQRDQASNTATSRKRKKHI